MRLAEEVKEEKSPGRQAREMDRAKNCLRRREEEEENQDEEREGVRYCASEDNMGGSGPRRGKEDCQRLKEGRGGRAPNQGAERGSGTSGCIPHYVYFKVHLLYSISCGPAAQTFGASAVSGSSG